LKSNVVPNTNYCLEVHIVELGIDPSSSPPHPDTAPTFGAGEDEYTHPHPHGTTASFGCADKPVEKHCWLICYERKNTVPAKKNKLKKTDYKSDEQDRIHYS
jgi:hypothetical protein